MILLKETIEKMSDTYNNIPIYYVEDGDNKFLSFGERMLVSINVNSFEEAESISDMILNRDSNAMFADPYRIGQWLENKGYQLIESGE